MFIYVDTPKLYEIGLKSPVSSFSLFDSDGKLYFQRDLKNADTIKLNINDVGVYKTDAEIKYIKTFPRVVWSCFIENLPEPEKNIEKKEMFFRYNGNLTHTPARIDVKTGRIEYGDFFINLPKPIQDFIILHEIGHNYYTTEKYADAYALKHYIENYGNPSQAFYALSKVFKHPEYQKERIYNIYNNIKK